MNTHDEHRLGRHKRRLEELRLWHNARERNLEEWRFAAGNGTKEIRLGDFWPEVTLPVTLSAETKVPEGWAGEPVELELWLGGEGFVRLSTGVSGGLNPFHKSFLVTRRARGGESVAVEAEVVPRSLFGSTVTEPRIQRAALVVPEREVRALERDIAMICESVQQLGDHEAVSHLLDTLDAAFATLAGHWPSGTETALTRFLQTYAGSAEGTPWSLPEAPGSVEPLSEESRRAVREARERVARSLEEIKAEYPPVGRLVLTGHAHLDLAWLWPVSETRRKGRRTFASVRSLMDRYEDFTFNQSSAQLYAWMEKDAPEIFERVKERIAEGRWETVGGAWTENDCQIPSGESMSRQLLYGQRYFKEKFGQRSTVAWLPDTFGFSPSVPQLLRSAGIDGFFTYKLNWSETNYFPYDLFVWEGIDGTNVVAHHYDNPGQDYNGNIVPHDLLGTWRNFRGKRRHPECLFAFGWGDGGGGPSEQMLENYSRLKDFPAMPRLRMGRVDEFFAALPKEGLPKWVGELYLELHRGTLTTQGKIKKLNRQAEHRLLEAEAFATLAALHGTPYPREKLEVSWKTLLFNQFHDVLPGTSIAEVYEEAYDQLEAVVDTAETLRDASLQSVSRRGRFDTPAASDVSDTLAVANAALGDRALTALIPDTGISGVSDSAGNPLPSQRIEEGLLVHSTEHRVPGLGWTVLQADREGAGAPVAEDGPWVRCERSAEGVLVENRLLRVELGADGTLHRVYDKQTDREVLNGRGNRLLAYVDKPRNWEAWDVDEDYELEAEEIAGVESIEVLEKGPLRTAVRVLHRWRGSTIEQTYRLLAESRRLDIETHVDWHERRVLLRTLFPVNVRSHEATFETMFGAHGRPTHRNTSWDAARFEVSAHRFCDLSEPGYGVALLNDGRYGHSARDNVLGISLLRSPLSSDPLSDEGNHSFTYSLYPHPGDWTESGVVEEAFALNSPLVIVPEGSGALPREFGLLKAEGTELALGALKRAEDKNGVTLRLYEPHGARGKCALRFATSVKHAERTNLLEEVQRDAGLTVDTDEIRFEVGPFEVLTLRIELEEVEG